MSGLALWSLEQSLPRHAGGVWQTSSTPRALASPTQSPDRGVSLLRVVPDEKPQGGEVSFGGSIVDRQGTHVCGCGGIPAAVTQQPVHHLGVAEAGSQMQGCGTRTVFVLWKESPLVLQSSPALSLAQAASCIPASWGHLCPGTSVHKGHRQAVHGGLSENGSSRL